MTTSYLQVIDYITNAFEQSTRSRNLFADAIARVRWEQSFDADGERYYVHESGLVFTTPSLDPFEVTRDWPAVFAMADGSGTVDVFGRTTRY